MTGLTDPPTLRQGATAVQQAVFSLLIQLPWLASLPDDEIPDLVDEVIDAIGLGLHEEDLSAAVGVLTAWKKTAEIHDDPDLLHKLTEPLSGTDHGQCSPG